MAINFEDLFDFSPQGDHGDVEDIDSYVEKAAENLFHPANVAPRLNTFGAASGSSPAFTLSASLPVALSASYTGSSSPGSSGGFGVRSAHKSGDSTASPLLLDDLAKGIATTAEVNRSGDIKGKRGRKPGQRSNSLSAGGSGVGLKAEMKNKLERSRQSARECRARKKLRYQYLDDLILEREKANTVLREELLKYQTWCHKLDQGEVPDGLEEVIKHLKQAGCSVSPK